MTYGVLPLSEVAHLDGLTLLRGMIAGDYPSAPIAEALNFTLTEAEEGRVVFEGTPNASHRNPFGTIHAGWTSAVMDSAMACAVLTAIKPGESYAAVEFKINCVRPLTAGMGKVACEARLLHRGRRSPRPNAMSVTRAANSWRMEPGPVRYFRSHSAEEGGFPPSSVRACNATRPCRRPVS